MCSPTFAQAEMECAVGCQPSYQFHAIHQFRHVHLRIICHNARLRSFHWQRARVQYDDAVTVGLEEAETAAASTVSMALLPPSSALCATQHGCCAATFPIMSPITSTGCVPALRPFSTPANACFNCRQTDGHSSRNSTSQQHQRQGAIHAASMQPAVRTFDSSPSSWLQVQTPAADMKARSNRKSN